MESNQSCKFAGTINITPKWIDLYHLYSEWIDSGRPEQKQLVKDELLKLCRLADEVNKSNATKAENGTQKV